MAYAYCNKHNVSWNSDKRDYCIQCVEQVEQAERPGDAMNAQANKIPKLPQGGVWARLNTTNVQVWVESINTLKQTALVRHICPYPFKGGLTSVSKESLSNINFGFVR